MKGVLLGIIFSIATVTSLNAADNNLHYPDRAWKLNQKGDVVVVYDIDSAGKPENVHVIHSEPAFLFDDSVVSQIYRWKFPKGNPQKNIGVNIVFSKN